MGLGLQLGHAQAELRGQALEAVGVDADAGLFHGGEDGGHAALQRLIDGDQVFLGQPGLEDVPEPQGDVGVLGGIGGGRFQGDVFEGFLGLAGARHGLERNGVVAEVEL